MQQQISAMDFILSPEQIDKAKTTAERFVSAVYPAPDMGVEKGRALKKALGGLLFGAIPYVFGAHDVGRGIAWAGAQAASRDYLAAKAREEVHKELFTNVLSKILEMQTEAYLTQERDEARRNAWERFMQLYGKIAGNAQRIPAPQLAGALLGAAVESGLDPAQLDMLNKVMGMTSKIAQDPDKAQKVFDFRVVPPGGALIRLNPYNGQIEPGYVNPTKPVDPSLYWYRLAQTQKYMIQARQAAFEEAMQKLLVDPKFSKYIVSFGKGSYAWRSDTPPEIREEAQGFVDKYVQMHSGPSSPGMSGIPMDNLNPEPVPEPAPAPDDSSHPIDTVIKGILGLDEEGDDRATQIQPGATLPPLGGEPEYPTEEDLKNILGGY